MLIASIANHPPRYRFHIEDRSVMSTLGWLGSVYPRLN